MKCQSKTIYTRERNEEYDQTVHNTVDSVHKTAVSRENLAVVLYADSTLDTRRGEVSEFAYSTAYEADCKRY